MNYLDRQSGEKLYLQLASLLEKQILSGDLKVGGKLPTQDDLCENYSVSKAVVRQALGRLANRGFIRQIPGKGTFIEKPAVTGGIPLTLKGVDVPLVEKVIGTVQVLKKEVTMTTQEQVKELGLKEPAKICLIARLRLDNGKIPFQLETLMVLHELAPGLALDDLRKESVLGLFRNKYGIPLFRITDSINPIELTKGEAEKLQKKPGEAALKWQRCYFLESGEPAALVEAIHCHPEIPLFYEISPK